MHWVLDTALEQSRIWQDEGRNIPVYVNISMYDLRDATFADLVAERLAVHGACPELLGIEVTESAAMADPKRTRSTLERLRTIGVRVAVDDFGTGYSSLAHLVAMPVDELKIDRSFVVGMSSSPQHAAIVRSTVSLGHDLNLTVIAEGVENASAAQQLRLFGCDLIQGYMVSWPLPAAELIAWVDKNSSPISLPGAAA